MADEYALGVRPSLEDAIEAVIRILGMQPCEGSDAVPPNARRGAQLGSNPGFRSEQDGEPWRGGVPGPLLLRPISHPVSCCRALCLPHVLAERQCSYSRTPSSEPSHVLSGCRSHTVLLSGTFVGGIQALVRLQFGIDAEMQVRTATVPMPAAGSH